MRKLLTFAAVTLVSLALSAGYWLQSNQVDEYLSLSLYRPFVYRQLMPMLARALPWLGIAPNWSIVIVMMGAGVGFYYALRVLVLHYYKGANELLIVGLWSLGLCLFWYERLPSDWATACLFSLAFLFLAQGRLMAYCLLYPIICLNRETAFLLTVLYISYFIIYKVSQGTYKYINRDLMIIFYQAFVWLVVRLNLIWAFAKNGGLNAWIYPLQNMRHFLADPLHSLLHIVIASVILYFVLKDWKSKPEFLRTAFVIFAPLLLIMYWVFGQPYEVRVLWEVFPVTVLLMLPYTDRIIPVVSGGKIQGHIRLSNTQKTIHFTQDD